MCQDDFRDNSTGKCKCFEQKTDKENFCIINCGNQENYDFYRNTKCVKGNIYATCCEYCAKDICLYFNPEVNLVPVGQDSTVILTKDETKKYLNNK